MTKLEVGKEYWIKAKFVEENENYFVVRYVSS